jgi:type IV pilus assembly protein PilA
MKRVQQGFTLIELMIVVAIIGILAAIALPAYQDYLARSQVSEAMTLADGLKTPVMDVYGQDGSCPTNGSNGIDTATNIKGKYVQSVTVAGTAPACTISAKMAGSGVGTGVVNGIVILTMTNNGGSLSWACTSTTIAQKYLPKACSGT